MSQKSTKFPDPTKGKMTKTVPDSETDINKIVARFSKTGQLPPPNREGQFSDVSEIPDLRTILEKIPLYKEILAASEKQQKLKVAEYQANLRKAQDAAFVKAFDQYTAKKLAEEKEKK
nr:MAG: internal scaffolding protein [Microviridae sp.]